MVTVRIPLRPFGNFFFNLLYPTSFCQCLSEETLPFLQCAIFGNVQVNWPKLFQDFSVKFTLIFSCMRSFNHSTSVNNVYTTLIKNNVKVKSYSYGELNCDGLHILITFI